MENKVETTIVYSRCAEAAVQVRATTTSFMAICPTTSGGPSADLSQVLPAILVDSFSSGTSY